MQGYESPRIKFEQLTFFEQIADMCWGAKTAVFNDPYECPKDAEYEVSICLSSGCGNDQQEDLLASVSSYLFCKYGPLKFALWLLESNNHSHNLANTKMKGIETFKS